MHVSGIESSVGCFSKVGGSVGDLSGLGGSVWARDSLANVNFGQFRAD